TPLERQRPRNDGALSDGVGRPPLTHEANGCKGAKGGTDAERKTRGSPLWGEPLPHSIHSGIIYPTCNSCPVLRRQARRLHWNAREFASESTVFRTEERGSVPKNAEPHRKTRRTGWGVCRARLL